MTVNLETVRVSKLRKSHYYIQATPDQKSVRNVRTHREMVIHIERTGFLVLGRIVTDDSRSKISRFSRNMPAYESVLSGLKKKIRHADFTTKHNDSAHHLIIQYWAYVRTVPIPEYLDFA